MGDERSEPVVPEPIERRGTAVSPGLGIGPAYVVDRRSVNVPHTRLERDQVDAELKRFRAGLRAAHDQLETIKGRLNQGEHRQILKAQQLMLRDPALVQRTESLIKDELINAEWAVSRSVDQVREMLAKVSDEYLSARQFDVAFMGASSHRRLACPVRHSEQPVDSRQRSVGRGQ